MVIKRSQTEWSAGVFHCGFVVFNPELTTMSRTEAMLRRNNLDCEAELLDAEEAAIVRRYVLWQSRPVNLDISEWR
jgi:hypothetical protein